MAYQNPFDEEFFAQRVATPSPKKDKGSAFGDIGASFGEGAGQLVRGVGTLLGGSDSAVAELGQSTVDYWSERKSDQLKASEQELGTMMQDDSAGMLDVAGRVVSDPRLMASMVASSAPSMAVGMGAGGLVARTMAAGGVMTTAGGGLTRAGSALAAGVGEGAVLVPDIYENTKGDIATATVGGMLLGVVTNLVTPGNIGAQAVRRMAGEGGEAAVEGVISRTVAGRVAGTVAAEGSQEFIQEGGQALLEQYGRDEALDFAAAGKQGAVGAVLGGVMGAGLHPVVGDGAPVKPDPLETRLTDINRALEAEPNNPVLMAEAAAVEARIVANRYPNPANEMQAVAMEARLLAERNPGNRDLQDAADHTTAEVVLATVGPDGVRAAVDAATAAADAALAEAPDVDSAVAAFAAREQASSVGLTAKAIVNVNDGLDLANTQEVSETFDESTAEIVTPEQELKLRERAAKAATAEARLQREIAKAKKEEITIEAPAENTEGTFPTTEGIESDTVSMGATREEVFARFAPEISAQEAIVNDVESPLGLRDIARGRAAALRSKRDRLAEGLPTEAELGYRPVFNPDESASRGTSVYDVVGPDGRVFDTYAGPAALQDAKATAERLSSGAVTDLQDAVADTPVRRNREAMVAAGFIPEVADAIEGAPDDELLASINALDTTPEFRRHAYKVLEERGVDLPIGRQQFEVREEQLARGLAEFLGNNTAGNERTVRERLRTLPESELRRMAQSADATGALARVGLAMRQGRHMGNVDHAPAQTASRTRTIADELREAAQEVAAEPAGETYEVESNFRRRAERAMQDGTLDKLGRFWKNLMSKPGQRTLPPIDTSDLVGATRAAVSSGRGIPQHTIDALVERYNAALKSAAQVWAREHNQPFDESRWVDPIINASAQGAGRGAGFSLNVRGIGRNGANPYMVRPGSPAAHFSADFSIHASSLSNAPGSADLAYRFAAHVADLRGAPFYADSILSTVNNLRRQLQSMSADTLFGSGVIHPLEGQRTSGNYQGMPVDLWVEARTPTRRIGLNALRAAHSITENRQMSGRTLSSGNIFENLVFDRRGNIVAASAPRHAGGFAEGTVVTEEMLQRAVGSTNPSTGYAPYAQNSGGTGGVGAATARLGILNNTILREIEGNSDATIPTWISRIAQAEGRRLDGWFFSKAPEGFDTESITAAEAADRLSGMVGEKAARILLDSGIITFVDTVAELTGETFSSNGKVQGATDPDGRVTLVLNNLTQQNFDAVLQHEGLHSTLENLVGADTYAKLMAKLDTLLKAGKGTNWAKAAEARVPNNTPAGQRLEEVAAYAVEIAAQAGVDPNPLTRWARDFMSAIRAAIIKSKLVPEALRVWAIDNLQPQDLQALALAGLKARAAGAGAGRRASVARDYAGEIESLLAEHRMPETTGPRRAEINAEIAKLRTAQRVEMDQQFANKRGYGTPIEGAVSVQGVHFSNATRTVLDANSYGTGARGEEAARLKGPENADIRPRVHFYVDEGNGINREQGVGSVGHEVKLNNLYDIREDKLGLRQADENAMERAIMAAGFDGYYAPNYRDMGQGVAVLLGNHSVPVEPYSGAGPTSRPASEQRDTYADNLRASKLPAGSMLGKEWAIAIKGSEFATDAVNAALAERAEQRLYRDDLPRLNKRRFSIAEEVKVGTEPVSPATPNEFNVISNRGRKAFERAIEGFRSAIQDKHVTLRRIQQLAGVTAEQIRIDTVGALDRLGSRLMSQQEELVRRPLAKIENILNRAGIEGDAGRHSLDRLLIDLHVKEYNAHIATINPARYRMEGGKRVYVSGFDAEHPGSGITDEEAQARIVSLLKAAERGEKTALALLEAKDVYRQMISDLQTYAVERGLEKQETIDSWNEKFPNYTPFNRELDLDENLSIGTVPGSQGFSLRAGIARRAMGSAADIVSPLVSTTLFGLKTTVRGENAVVARTMLNFAREFVPNYMDAGGNWKPMWKVETIPTQRVLKKVNVYRTKMADGQMSPEFYNREQARDYADYQQQLWEQMNPDADPNTSGIIVQQEGDGPQNRVVVQKIPNPLGDEFTMVIPEDGENRVIVFDKHSHDAVAIMNALKGRATSGPNAETINRALLLPRMFSRWVMATSTGFNPVFSLFNAARDVQGAMISIGSDKVPGWTAADSLAIGRNFFSAAGSIWRHRGQVFRAMHSNGTRPSPKPGSYAAWAEEATRYGGVTGVRDSVVDIDGAETQIRRLFGQAEVARIPRPNETHDQLTNLDGALVKIGDAFARFGEGETKVMGLGWISRNVVSATARLNEAAELATRTAVFKAVTEKHMLAGKSEVEAKTLAANIAKNVSTNFNRRGNLSSTINQLYPFFNAATQGTARIAETLFEKETYKVDKNGVVAVDQRTKMTPYGKIVVGALASIGGLQAALLAIAGFDDDEPPAHIKDRAFIIPLGFGGDYIAIPMPHGFNTLVNFGRNMADATINPEKAGSYIASALWQAPAFNPFGSAGNVATDFLPAIVDPAISLYMNEDAFGRPIAKENPDPANPTPGFTRAKEGASPFSRRLAEGLNSISGGNEDQKGVLSPTPDQIDFVIGIAGGGVGRELIKAGTVATNAVSASMGNETESIPTHKLPLIGRLYGDINEPVALRSKMFNLRQEINEKYARYKGLRERGDTVAADSFWDENPELALRDDFERFVRQDAKQRKNRALARSAEELSEVNRITSEQDEKIADLLQRYRELKD